MPAIHRLLRSTCMNGTGLEMRGKEGMPHGRHKGGWCVARGPARVLQSLSPAVSHATNLASDYRSIYGNDKGLESAYMFPPI